MSASVFETAQFITARLPTRYGEFRISVLPQDGNDKRSALVTGAETLPIADKEHVVLAMGDLAAPGPAPLLRLHSECLTGDALHSLRCDCGFQLEAALSMIAAEGRGVILYLRQEGRGIGLVNKLRAYALQDQGQDTVEANVSLGFGPDQRDYSDAISLLRALNLSAVRLMTNNPRKVKALEDAGISVTERVPMKFGSNPHNFRYLEAKSSKLGHLL